MSIEKRRALTVLLSILLLLTLAFIWGNSLLDRTDSAQLSRGVLDFLKPLLEVFGLNTDDDHWLRKLAHFMEFGVLGAELCLLFALYRPLQFRPLLFSAAISLAVAAVDETIQLYSGRFSSVKDVMIDFSGSVVGICLIFLISRAVNRPGNKKRT